MAAIDLKALKRIIQAAISARPVEIGCRECLAELDVFAEQTLADKEIPEALRLVREHLERCVDCREEFESLLVALRSVGTPE